MEPEMPGKKFNSRITIPFLLKNKADLLKIPEFKYEFEGEEGDAIPGSIEQLIIFGLYDFEREVRATVKDWYQIPKIKFEQMNIHCHINVLMDYVLNAKMEVDAEELSLVGGRFGVDHESYHQDKNPILNSGAKPFPVPGKLTKAIWAVYDFWLLGERLIGMRPTERTVGMRAFSVFAATAFIRFRIDSGRWHEYELNEKELEPTFNSDDLGLILGVWASKKDLNDSVGSLRGRYGFRGDDNLNGPQLNTEWRLRMFSETYIDNSDKNNIEKLIYSEVNEYFLDYVNRNERDCNLTHSEMVYFLKNRRSTKFTFTEYFVK